MDLRELQQQWNRFGQDDPMWAISTIDGTEGNRWAVDDFFATGRTEVADVLAWVASLGAAPEHGRALDFGCGIGRLCQALGDWFERVDGVDIAPSMLDAARRHNRHDARVAYHLNARNDLRELFADGTFDFVYSKSVLQHMEPRFAASYIAEFVRVLVPGSGVAVFQQHAHPVGRAERVRAWLKRRLPSGAKTLVLGAHRMLGNGPVMELYGMSPDEVRDAVRAAGGETIRFEQDPTGSGSWTTYRYLVRKL